MRKVNLGWLESLLGVLVVAVGIYTFVTPDADWSRVMDAYGLLAIVVGVSSIVFYSCFERRTGLSLILSLLAGISCVVAGILILLDFVVGGWAFIILFPAWFLMQCFAHLCSVGEMSPREETAPGGDGKQDEMPS